MEYMEFMTLMLHVAVVTELGACRSVRPTSGLSSAPGEQVEGS